MCPALLVKNVEFGAGTPMGARFKFSHGLAVNHFSEGYQQSFAKCELFDFTGKIAGDENMPAGSEAGKPAHLMSGSRNYLPPDIVRDCKDWYDHPERQDNPDSAGACLWWIREYPELLQAVMSEDQVGLIKNSGENKEYTQIEGRCDTVVGDEEFNNILLCNKMNLLTFAMDIPNRIVSGSEVLYGPVGVVSQRVNSAGITVFDQGNTIVDIYQDTEWGHGNPMQENPNGFLEKHPQPQFITVPSGGSYRLEFTGDIGVFKDDYLHFKIMNPSHRQFKHSDVDSNKIVLSFRFMKAAKINCYYDGRLQPPAFKQSEVNLEAPKGTGYLHPMTRIFSFVLRTDIGDRLTSLKFLNIVEVEMGVNIDFATFFAENDVDPVTISPEFKHLIPPTYEQEYNPKDLIREDPFIRNMAAVLQINPERIKITNIVPGNGRRRRMRMLKAMGYSEREAEALQADFYEFSGDRRFLESGDDGLDLGFEIAETDPCETVVCGMNGQCNNGKCDCNDGWYSVGAYSYNSTDPVTGDVQLVSVNASEPCAVNQTEWTKLFNSSSTSGDDGDGPKIVIVEVEEEEIVSEESGGSGGNATNATNATSLVVPQDSFAELVSVAASLSDAAGGGTLDLGYEVL
jgi:hypothetical protein